MTMDDGWSEGGRSRRALTSNLKILAREAGHIPVLSPVSVGMAFDAIDRRDAALAESRREVGVLRDLLSATVRTWDEWMARRRRRGVLYVDHEDAIGAARAVAPPPPATDRGDGGSHE